MRPLTPVLAAVAGAALLLGAAATSSAMGDAAAIATTWLLVLPPSLSGLAIAGITLAHARRDRLGLPVAAAAFGAVAMHAALAWTLPATLAERLLVGGFVAMPALLLYASRPSHTTSTQRLVASIVALLGCGLMTSLLVQWALDPEPLRALAALVGFASTLTAVAAARAWQTAG